ncbi:hypothetical protein [Pseudomonas abieticivorans]|uniref:hypothetical protein n=1 Tax=Pseudomonas abieticivorans TaxID=2931382 RepID=UPI0020C1462A|nr:hypothetical protein [Pseudomonas sp. PIA16]
MQAPTDNLYKFMAIAGLVCSLFFYFDYHKRYDALIETINLRKMEAVIISAKVEAIQGKQDLLKERMAEAEKNKEKLEAWLELRKSWENSQPLIDEVSLLQAQNVQNVEFVKESIAELDYLLCLYKWLGIPSLLLSVIGMILWYVMTQRFLDIKERKV